MKSIAHFYPVRALVININIFQFEKVFIRNNDLGGIPKGCSVLLLSAYITIVPVQHLN